DGDGVTRTVRCANQDVEALCAAGPRLDASVLPGLLPAIGSLGGPAAVGFVAGPLHLVVGRLSRGRWPSAIVVEADQLDGDADLALVLSKLCRTLAVAV